MIVRDRVLSEAEFPSKVRVRVRVGVKVRVL
jgi:hypothetical protein